MNMTFKSTIFYKTLKFLKITTGILFFVNRINDIKRYMKKTEGNIIKKAKKGVLIYVGMHLGGGFSSIFEKYKICYGFEANPELYAKLKIKFGTNPRVKLFNVAVTDYDGEIEFNISNYDGASSIGNFSEDWEGYKFDNIKMIKTIKVPCINLYNFLQQHNIDLIEDYISDIQGFDLGVLKTLKPYIDEKKIKHITCEVAKDKYGNTYTGIPDNSENGFNVLLKDNYECVAKGFGILTDGEFDDVPDICWEMDYKWRVKKRLDY